MQNTKSPASFNWRAWLPLFVFLVAFITRLVGIGWGLPNELHAHSYHPDEPIVFAYSQQIEPAKLDFDPGFYNYGTIYLSILRIASDVVAGYGAAPDPERPESFIQYIAATHLAGRILNALAGAGMAVVLFLMMRPRIGNLGGLAAAAIIAFAPGLVVHSRFQTVDMMAAFFISLSAYYALRLLPDDKVPGKELNFALLAGLFAGLSASTKYTGVLALLTVYSAIAISRHKDWLKLAAIATLFCVLAFVLTTPGALLNPGKFIEDFRYEMAHTSEGHGLVFAGTQSGFLYHLGNLAVGTGFLAAGLGVAGLVFAAVLRRPWALALLAFFIPYYLLIGRAEVKFVRYTFPLYIGLAAGFGWAVAASHRRPGWARAVAAVGILALGGESPLAMVRGTVNYSMWMAGQDPRDSAALALRGQDVAVGLVEDPWFYTPPFYAMTTAPRGVPPEERLELMDAAREPRVVMSRTPEGGVVQWDPRLVSEVRPEYIAISSFEAEDRARLAALEQPPERYALHAQQYENFQRALEDSYEVAAIFGNVAHVLPHDMEYVRPTITLWKRKDLP